MPLDSAHAHERGEVGTGHGGCRCASLWLKGTELKFEHGRQPQSGTTDPN